MNSSVILICNRCGAIGSPYLEPDNWYLDYFDEDLNAIWMCWFCAFPEEEALPIVVHGDIVPGDCLSCKPYLAESEKSDCLNCDSYTEGV